MAVSWQVLPMFYMTPTVPRSIRRTSLGLVAVSAFAISGALVVDAPSDWLALAAAPVATAVWVVHPLSVLWTIRRRRRKRAELSLRFWQAGMVAGLATGLLGVGTVLSGEPRLATLFGWVAIWGWAGILVHGMLTRIVPFLVWFHRYAPRIGYEDVPPMLRILPQSYARAALVCHGAMVVFGVAALVTAWRPLIALTGILLVATGVIMAAWLFKVLSHLRN